MHDQHDDDKLILWKMTTAIGNAPEYSDMVHAHNNLAGFVMQVACWLVTCGILEEDFSLRQKQLRKDAFRELTRLWYLSYPANPDSPDRESNPYDKSQRIQRALRADPPTG